MTFLTTKAVSLKTAKNLTASIVSHSAVSSGAPYLRFAFDSAADFGTSASGKTQTCCNANELLVEDGNFRVSVSAYRKVNTSPSDVCKAIVKESAASLSDPKDGETIGAVLPYSKGRGFVARGNTQNGHLYIDIPANTIATLTNPKSTYKERDVVAPLTTKGTKRLLASSGGYCPLLGGLFGLTLNIMLDLESLIAPQSFANALGVALDDPLLVSLCGGVESMKVASSKKSSSPSSVARTLPTPVAASTNAESVVGFSSSVRMYLSEVSETDVADAVHAVFAAKVATVAAGVADGSVPAAEAYKILSKLKTDAVRSWVVSRLVDNAVAQAKSDIVVGGGDVAAVHQFVPSSNDEVADLFDSIPEKKLIFIKSQIKDAMLSQLADLTEDDSGAFSFRPHKKNRAE